MSKLTRRIFMRSVGASAISFPYAQQTSAQTRITKKEGKKREPLPRGYLIGLDLSTYATSRPSAISTATEADEIFAKLDGRVNALEFPTLYYTDYDLRAHEAVARVGVANKVDLWASTYNFRFKFRAFGAVRPEFQAHVMEADGRIVPAERSNNGKAPEPLFDVLNPEAMDWFLAEFRNKYLERMKGLLSGLFFNEDCVEYLAKCVEKRRFDYWRNTTFSPRVLTLWRDYCRENNIIHGGKLVDKFPVHNPKMVANGGGLTAYFSDWSVPDVIERGQRFVKMPQAKGIWKHWHDFICCLFLKNWIGRMAQLANEVNRDEARWKGVMYFGLHYWSLPYEQISNPQFQVPAIHEWGAWGRQRGVDLERLAAHPEVDAVICETYPPIAANLDDFVSEYGRITRMAGKTFGVMLHRDDKWALKLDEEARRWALIGKHKPTVIARYPMRSMLPGNQYYNQAGEMMFAKGLAKYRRSYV